MPILLSGLIWLAGAVILIGGSFGQQHPLPGQRPFSATMPTSAKVGTLAEQWTAYRRAVNHYAESHKGVSAPTPCWSQTQLELNASPQIGWGCRITIGPTETVWVYGPVPSGAMRVATGLMDNPVNVGINRGGVLTPPNAPNFKIAVPVSISPGDLVSVEQIH